MAEALMAVHDRGELDRTTSEVQQIPPRVVQQSSAETEFSTRLWW